MRRFSYIMLCVLALCSCTPKTRLVILHVNDTHSHFEALRGGDLDGQGGCIERAAFVDSVRSAEGAGKVLLLHAGDFGQGTSYFNRFGGELEIEVLNSMKYDCVALGNHEFDNGIEDLCRRLKRLECPVVCANLDLSQFELGQVVKPYAILERGGMKIGIIGAITDISTVVSKTISSRIQQLDPAESINRWAAYLHKTEKCDMIILLSHMGYKEDQAVIPETRFLDIVIGGHSHTYVEDFVWVEDAGGKAVPITQDGGWGLQVGKVTVSGGC